MALGKTIYVQETISNQCIHTCRSSNLKPHPHRTQPIVYNSQKCLCLGNFFTSSNQCIYTCRSCLQNISFVKLKPHPAELIN